MTAAATFVYVKANDLTYCICCLFVFKSHLLTLPIKASCAFSRAVGITELVQMGQALKLWLFLFSLSSSATSSHKSNYRDSSWGLRGWKGRRGSYILNCILFFLELLLFLNKLLLLMKLLGHDLTFNLVQHVKYLIREYYSEGYF